MKYAYQFSLLVIALLSFQCEGPPGPQGLPGYNGLDGLNGEEAYVFEYILDFTAPEYSALLELPSSFEMLDSDVMIVYLLWRIMDDGTEVWRALPQTLYFQDGILSYNYDWTKFDAELFLEGTVNLGGLGANLTDEWIARVVVVPGLFNGRSTLDFNNYEQVKAAYDLPALQLDAGDYPSRPD